ncbi:MAG TPA: CARDB domain-containing protein, partial [Gemmatimonadales bacterium]|nr:CARDB domain-containing protein [Gemmatimonadales bacterium]
DGAHNGNPDFFFLPPLFKNPNNDPNYEPAGSNPNLKPAVEICELGPPAADLSRQCIAGPPLKRFNPSAVTYSDQQYQVNWKTDETPLDVAKFYRINVLVGTALLGFADVDPVSSSRDLKNVQTNEYIPLQDGRTLPIKFRIETGALCAVDGTPCASKTVNLAAGGGIELVGGGEDFKFDIPSGTTATFGGQAVSDVTFNLEVCSGIDVDLPKVGACLRVGTFFNATGGTGELVFSNPILISLCVLNQEVHNPDETRQEGLLTLHQQDGAVIRALPHASPNCNTIGMSFWDRVKNLAARVFEPRPAIAASRNAVLHVGGGGETDRTGATCPPPGSAIVPKGIFLVGTCPPSSPAFGSGEGPRRSPTAAITPPHTVSDFQFALPAMMDFLDPADASRFAPPGTSLPTAVKVTDWDGNAVQGAQVTFIQPVIEGPPTILGTATSNSDGIAQISWTIAAGSNTAVATGRGIAAQNNYPNATVKPFMPDISLPTNQEEAVFLGNGRVSFLATGGQADLIVTALTHSPSDATDADLIDFGVTVQNVGTLAAGPFGVVTETVGHESVSIAGLAPEQTSLAPGESVTRCCWHLHRLAGEYTQTARVDFHDEVPESNETNNTLTNSYSVRAVVYTGSVGDPAGDVPAGEPDLVSATATVAEGGLTLHVDFAPGTRATTTRASFTLDVDRSPLTGFPGTRSGGGVDAEFLGVEFLVQMGSDFVGPTLRIVRYDGTSFVDVANTIPITFSTDALEATIPLDVLLGNSNGTLNYKVSVQRQLTATGFTGVLDDMTDIGLPPGMVVPPIP